MPPGWDFDGAVSVRFGNTVDVQVRDGVPTAVGLHVERRQLLNVRSPWPGEEIRVTDARTGASVVNASRASKITFVGSAGGVYRIHKTKDGPEGRFERVDGVPATMLRKLGQVQIGLGPAQ